MQPTRLNLDMCSAQPTRIRPGTWLSLRSAVTRYGIPTTCLSSAYHHSSQYADLSEFGYGVAILSESKYGFSCRGNVLRISLLRAATAPDAEQDQGKHEFSWAVMPHQGSFLESDVPIAAYLFNSPLHGTFLRISRLTCHTHSHNSEIRTG